MMLNNPMSLEGRKFLQIFVESDYSKSTYKGEIVYVYFKHKDW